MHRRLLISALAGWPATRLLAEGDSPRPRHKVSADELDRALSARFPVRFVLAGLLDVQVTTPRLRMLPARQRIGAIVSATIGELQTGRVHPGEMDLLFALRYEAADQTLRAHALEIARLKSPALPPEAVRAWQPLLQNIARNAVGEVVVHRLTPRELAVPDSLGLQPGDITVQGDGVVIWFVPKTRA